VKGAWGTEIRETDGLFQPTAKVNLSLYTTCRDKHLFVLRNEPFLLAISFSHHPVWSNTANPKNKQNNGKKCLYILRNEKHRKTGTCYSRDCSYN